jgi:FixJ family two-component response regulator
VFVVDDDLSVRESLQGLIRASGWQAQTFASAGEFLARPRAACPNCLILDISLPDLTGLELQKLLAADHADMPIIFVTGHRDVPMTVQAMKAGAVEFLTKPLSADVLLNAVRSALDQSCTKQGQEAQLTALRHRYASLSPREKEVMSLVVRGRLNKLVAAELGISEITVKSHRGAAMRKMQARSFAELVRMADALGIACDPRKDAARHA